MAPVSTARHPGAGPPRGGRCEHHQTGSVDLAAAQRLIELVHGTWQTHVVAAMAELELADRLSAGPRSVAELAEQAAANPDALERLLRACAALGLVHDKGPRVTP